MKKILAPATLVAAFVVAGCATQIPTQRDTGSLKLSYETQKAGVQTGKTVAIVSPHFLAAETGSVNHATAQIFLQRSQNQPYVPQAAYELNYKKRLGDAMMNTIQDMVSSKGFKTKGPFASFDDIPFGDKKDIYLVAMPSIKIYFDQKRNSQACKGMVCTDNGQFTIGGELIYKMVEPLTGQSLMTKRVNLNEFSITRDYVKEYQVRDQSDGLLGMVLDKAANPESLQDNTDRAMTEALNEFFTKSMSKIDTLVSREELVSFEKDVSQLKGLKRF